MDRCFRCEEEALASYTFKKQWTPLWGISRYYTVTKLIQRNFPTCWDCYKDFRTWKKIHLIQMVFLYSVVVLVVSSIWIKFLRTTGVIFIILEIFLYAIVSILKKNPNNYIKYKKRESTFYVNPERSSDWILYQIWVLQAKFMPKKPKKQIPQEAWDHYDTGIYYLGQENIENALEKFDNALKVHPEFPQALSEKGKILGELQKYEKALSILEEALKYDPDLESAKKTRDFVLKVLKDAEGYYNSGIYHLGRENLEDALEKFDNALKLRPEFPQALTEKGKILAELQKYEEALVFLEEALKYDPDLESAKKTRVLVLEILD